MGSGVMTMILLFAMGAVLVTLILGLVNMFRGGKDPLKSNKLMQIRVALQVLALIMFAFLLWNSRG